MRNRFDSLTRLAGLFFTVFFAGCATAPPAPTGSKPDRLKQHYSDLSSGRFLILADFEDPAHTRLFELVNASGQAQMNPQSAGGRAETGAAALTFTAGSPRDSVVAGSGNASGEYLKRDWRAFDLLMASIHSPAAGLAATIGVASGAGGNRRLTETAVPLQPGWNLLRLDLAELAENINIDDVQELRFSVTGQRRPAEVVIDDILLTASREDLFGDPSNIAGGLYVQRVARRWNIGAGGAFEVTIMNGQIRRLHNLRADPHRVHNLLEGGSLGPIPVAVDAAGTPASLSPPRARIAVQQRIVEMNAVRAIVEITWSVDGTPEMASANGRGDRYRWQYVIYSSGQMYVTAELVQGDERKQDTPVGAAVILSASQMETFTARLTGIDGEPGDSYGWATHGPTATLLTLVPAAGPGAAGSLRAVRNDAERQATFIIDADSARPEALKWTIHVAISPDAPSDAQARALEALARANAYAKPSGLQLSIGSIHGSAEGTNEFDVSLGHWIVAADSDRVRSVVGANNEPTFSPAFVVEQSAGREGWVYVDHLVHQKVARDANGNLLYQVPGFVQKPTLVEVILRSSPSSSMP